MRHHYRDIRDRIDQDPLWWDENGVPRYCEFSPRETGNIYCSQAVLLRIACQECGRLFEVAMTWGVFHELRNIPPLDEQVRDDSLHYGDPPNTSCCPAGATMNSIPLRVIQFWLRDEAFEWLRMSDLEIGIVPDWAKDR